MRNLARAKRILKRLENLPMVRVAKVHARPEDIPKMMAFTHSMDWDDVSLTLWEKALDEHDKIQSFLHSNKEGVSVEKKAKQFVKSKPKAKKRKAKKVKNKRKVAIKTPKVLNYKPKKKVKKLDR